MEEMPQGFRFYPTEEELVSFYLHNKLEQRQTNYIDRVIPLLDVYHFEPWQLPRLCGELCHGDPEQWFFFAPRQEREVRGGKPSRTTESGYWKATGSPSYVYSSNGRVIGVKKSMVYYKGKAPTGRKTKWKMNEYRAIKKDQPNSTPKLLHEVSVCRIYVVSGSLRAFDRRPTSVDVTGSLRAFDRWPTSMETSTSTSGEMVLRINSQENDDGRVGVSNTNYENAKITLMEAESCSSESNSFSEGNKSIEYDVENGGASNSSNWEMLNSLENLMEWENM